MNSNDRITEALETAARTTGDESRWNLAHAEYIKNATADRVLYRALLGDAADMGVDAAAFNAKVRSGIDAEAAANDTAEWTRVGLEVLSSLVVHGDYTEEPTGPTHEQARYLQELDTERVRLHG